ncbi:uncharacterized protein LOC113335407 isoform X1 [Papaver somniferum]|uniref:uncharacterized protein LOC113335407 isoform X1 n=1 Tax=Papaver somniferum TaxID=3469 RepID=UPI000E6FBD93|nr:uncharacterized protein LOC113335407 isoform X1 [Papaver somniferum]
MEEIENSSTPQSMDREVDSIDSSSNSQSIVNSSHRNLAIERSRSSFLNEHQTSVSQPLPSPISDLRASPQIEASQPLTSAREHSGYRSSAPVDRSGDVPESSHPSLRTKRREDDPSSIADSEPSPSEGGADESTAEITQPVQELINNLKDLHKELCSTKGVSWFVGGGFKLSKDALKVFKSKFTPDKKKRPNWMTRNSYRGFKEQMRKFRFKKPPPVYNSTYRHDQHEFVHKDFKRHDPDIVSIVLNRRTVCKNKEPPSPEISSGGPLLQSDDSLYSDDSLSSSSPFQAHHSSAGQAASGALEYGDDSTKLEFLEGFHSYLRGEEDEGVTVENGFLFTVRAYERFKSLIRLPPGGEKPRWLSITEESQFFDLMRNFVSVSLKLVTICLFYF